MKTVKVTTGNKVSIINVDFSDFRSIQQAIGGHFETVRTQLMVDYFKDPSVIMLVDEEGLVKELPMNAVGCTLYRGIVAGDLIFAKTKGEDIIAPENAEAMIERLIGTFIGLKRA